MLSYVSSTSPIYSVKFSTKRNFFVYFPLHRKDAFSYANKRKLKCAFRIHLAGLFICFTQSFYLGQQRIHLRNFQNWMHHGYCIRWLLKTSYARLGYLQITKCFLNQSVNCWIGRGCHQFSRYIIFFRILNIIYLTRYSNPIR